LLAAYDLGATAPHLKKIYEDEAQTQRPIVLEEKDSSIKVNDDNWVQYLGNQKCVPASAHEPLTDCSPLHSAYAAFVDFFSVKVKELGVSKTLERYVYDEAVNEKGKDMLIRLMSGVYVSSNAPLVTV